MSTLLGPWTNKDSLRKEIHASQALAEVLELAWKEDLPALQWSVSPLHGLTGTVPLDYKDRDERAQWRRWVHALGAVVSTSFVSGDHEFLRAKVDLYRTKRGNPVVVHLRADVLTDAALAELMKEEITA